jgi:hypothetical protein
VSYLISYINLLEQIFYTMNPIMFTVALTLELNQTLCCAQAKAACLL